MNFVVYILRSLKDGNFYIGQTGNLKKRILFHETGMVKSTKSRRPFELIHTEFYQTRSEAVRRERHLKSFKGGNGFKKIISQNITSSKKVKPLFGSRPARAG